jgi:lysozyme
VKIGAKGIALIQSYEKCRLRAYLPTPNDVWTCGWGSTEGVTQHTVWTQDEADARFLADIAWVENCVNKAVTAQLTQNEFDALCSLCFNIGCPRFGSSSLVKALNNGDYDSAAKHFCDWNKQHGEVLAGLTNRRCHGERRTNPPAPPAAHMAHRCPAHLARVRCADRSIP